MKNTMSGHLFTSDNVHISYDHYKHKFDKVIILAHGFYNSKQALLFKDMARMLGEYYDVIVFDFRGHGKSSGLFYWTAKEYLDLEAVLNYANQHYRKIGVIGFSLGAATGLLTAAKFDLITSLIVVSAPTQFNKIDFRFWELGVEENIQYNIFGEGRIGKGVRPGPLWAKKVNPIDVVSRIHIPIFFMHGARDWLIQPWHSQKLYEKAKCQKRLEIIENASHAEYIFRRDPEHTMKMFLEWFEQTLFIC